MRIKILCLLFFVFLTVTNVFADTILLKSGQQVEGSIKERTADSIKLEIEGIPLTYYINDIDSINGQKVTAPSVSSGSVSTPAPSVQKDSSVSAQTESVSNKSKSVTPEPVAGTGMNATKAEALSDEKIEPFKQEKGTQDEQSQAVTKDESSKYPFSTKSSTKIPSFTPAEARLAAGVFAGMFLFIMILGIVGFVYSALCLYFIAKKVGIEPAWLAWIPIGNLFLMCKIGDISYIWLAGLLVQFVPIIGILGLVYSAGLFIYIWYKIIIARDKPGWFVVLMIIPIANLVIMGYLAFAD